MDHDSGVVFGGDSKLMRMQESGVGSAVGLEKRTLCGSPKGCNHDDGSIFTGFVGFFRGNQGARGERLVELRWEVIASPQVTEAADGLYKRWRSA